MPSGASMTPRSVTVVAVEHAVRADGDGASGPELRQEGALGREDEREGFVVDDVERRSGIDVIDSGFERERALADLRDEP